MGEITKQDLPVVAAQNLTSINDYQSLGSLLASSGYFADARDAAQAAVKVMAGSELGIPPIASMMGIHIIKGKVALGAHMIASRIKAHGYDIKIKQLDNTACILDFIGKDGKSLGESSFTEEDAKQAGIYGEMHRKFPRNMYYSRSISNGAKWFTPEIFGGAPVYTPEELGAKVNGEGEVIDTVTETPKDVRDRRVAEEKKKLEEQRKAAAETQKPEPFKATDADLPGALGGTDPQPAPAIDEEKRREMRDRAAQPTEASACPWRTMTERLNFFKEIKEKVGEQVYYETLKAYGVEHANKFSSNNKAVECYHALLDHTKELV